MFRRPADDPATAAIARLMQAPPDAIRGLAALVVPYRESSRARPRREHADRARARGFQRLGCLAEHVFPSLRKDVYVDGPRTTQAHLSERGYFFVTYFEGGTCVITWSHRPRTPSTDVLASRPTCGGFDADYDAHLRTIESHGRTDVPIPVRDLDAALSLGRIYYRLIVPRVIAARTLLWQLFRLACVVLAILWLVHAYRSFEHTMMTAPP